jgi:hypothetical protein
MTAQYESLRCTQGLPATWELIYMAAFASGRGPPAASVPGEQSVPVDRIRLRTRP